VFGDVLETLWKNCFFGLCGIKTVYCEMFTVVVAGTLEQRENWLEGVQEEVEQYLPQEKCA